MIFVSFNAEYVDKLRAEDAATEGHFTHYFGELLFLKLRYRIRNTQLIEDIRQETMLRVLKIVRTKGVDHPERLGAFVHAVCNNVLLEQLRSETRHFQMAEDAPDPVDESVDLDAPLIGEEMRELIDNILEALPMKDRSLLRMLFLEELPKEEICRLLNVDANYLRVLLHRAKSRFRAEYLKRATASELARKAFP